MVLPGSAVPLKVGVLSLLGLGPPKETSLAAAGACVSTGRSSACEGSLVLPAASVMVTLMLWLPSASGSVVKLQAPLSSAVVVPRGVLPYSTVFRPPGSAVPLKVGVLSLLGLGPPKETSLAAAGA